MLHYVLDAALALKPQKLVVVIGKTQQEALLQALKPYGQRLQTALQSRPLGTAHALRTALRTLGDFAGPLVAINGDTPLITPKGLRKLLRLHHRHGNALSLASFMTARPAAYGRILRRDGVVVGIREASELGKNPALQGPQEVNGGLYVFEPEALRLLGLIRANPKRKEYYLTDILELCHHRGLKAEAYALPEEELKGVNTLAELQEAEALLRDRLLRSYKGVRFLEPSGVFIHHGVKIGPGSIIYPNVYLEGRTVLGKGCIIYPNVRIIDSTLKDGAVVKDCSLIEGSWVGSQAQVGPFAHLRPGSRLRRGCRVGNFVEVKNTSMGEGSKALHLSYLGDAVLGKGVNIGAGTITCNYDGLRKYRTVIEDGAFIGSDSQLVAPVKVGKGAYVAAGSTINKDVPPGGLGISRCRQRNIPGWTKKRRRRS
jgi:bifunctional UDP-N-acetylglucosamine pyrophosphorylase/glucosamine-1-phosphate N-acetyltransferase